MTISSEVNKHLYAGNSATTVFPYTFKILNEAHLLVILGDSDGSNEVTQVLNTDYTVTGVGEESGGTVVMAVAPATGKNLSIARDVPKLQETDLENQGAIVAETLEEAYDYLTMITQQMQEELDRAPKVSQTSGLTGQDLLDVIDAQIAAAEASAAAALVSETNAAASEAAALVSETNAAASEANAATSETNAAASEAAALVSETNAAASAAAALVSETNAAASAAAALVSETNAATSETNAATSASNAATSETNAATSASNAATSETNAAASAAAALVSETNADASAVAAAASAATFFNEWDYTVHPTNPNATHTTRAAAFAAANGAGGGKRILILGDANAAAQSATDSLTSSNNEVHHGPNLTYVNSGAGTSLSITGDRNNIIGGRYSGFTTGVDLPSGADYNSLTRQRFVSCTNNISDAGLRNQYEEIPE